MSKLTHKEYAERVRGMTDLERSVEICLRARERNQMLAAIANAVERIADVAEERLELEIPEDAWARTELRNKRVAARMSAEAKEKQ